MKNPYALSAENISRILARYGDRTELMPFAAISDEHAITAVGILFPEGKKIRITDRLPNAFNVEVSCGGATHQRTNVRLNIHSQHGEYFDSLSYCSAHLPLVYQYLENCGYAMPVFIAPGHPHNGKTPIELGIAEVTKVAMGDSVA